MNLLLDTHTLLWFLSGDQRIPLQTVATVADRRNNCYVSMASLWEVSIKIALGKLSLDFPFSEFPQKLELIDFRQLPITFSHIDGLRNIPNHHRDPFDRLIIGQALEEGMTVVTKDAIFREYPVRVLWDS